MKKNIGDLKNIEVAQGDAVDLSRFQDNSFDVTLLFGPMYHLYEESDQKKALQEAIRVTKTGGDFLRNTALLLFNGRNSLFQRILI